MCQKLFPINILLTKENCQNKHMICRIFDINIIVFMFAFWPHSSSNANSIHIVCFFIWRLVLQSIYNIIEYLLLGKDFLWSKAINLLNMSLKDSPGICTVNVIGFVICLNTHKHIYISYIYVHVMCCMKFSGNKNHICWRCKLSDMTSRPLAIQIWWSIHKHTY